MTHNLRHKLGPLILTVSLLFGCTPANKNAESEFIKIDDKPIILDAENVTKIFYNLPSPVAMSRIVENSGATLQLDLLNPVSRADSYSLGAYLALNMGVYGVDLGYLKLYEQTQKSLLYLNAVGLLSEKLGLPKGKIKELYNEFERNSEDKEKQIKLLANQYEDANKYLKEQNRESVATLVILGGWIEGLYIATQTYKRDAKEKVLERIAQQKYSLNTIIALISDNQGDEVVSRFLPSLLLLKKVYDNILIDFTNANADIDTVNKVIILNDKSKVHITAEELGDVTRIVEYLRQLIIL